MPHFNRSLVISYALGAAALLASVAALADPPDRVARLSYLNGTVSFEPAGGSEWVEASRNRPMITGDQLWADNNSRAEVDLGRETFWIDSQTAVTMANVDDHTAQVQVGQGNMVLDVRRVDPNDVVEVDTPNLAVNITQPGFYRINVAADGSTTYVQVRRGQASVTGQGQSYVIGPNESYSFSGQDLANPTYYDVPQPDELDQFCLNREQIYDRAAREHYVSPEVVGYEDLEENGTWRDDPDYGHVWVPRAVPSDWAPYHDGHWAWVEPWGWTWVDDQPWGFAPFHYGRWAHFGWGWGWVPGPVAVRPVYAPALVAFVGGGGGASISLTIGGGAGIAWFPLGPREVYRPAYEVSPTYIRNVNVSNTTVTNVQITNVVNNVHVTNVTYVNQTVPGAVVGVPARAFAGGQPVARAAVAVGPQMMAHASIGVGPGIAPTARALAPTAQASARPPQAALARPVVAHTQPPPPPVPFAMQQKQLEANKGRPLAPAQVNALRAQVPAAERPMHQVQVVQAPKPSAPPPKVPANAAAHPGAPGSAAAPGRPEAGRPAAEAAHPTGAPARPEIAHPTPARPEAAHPAPAEAPKAPAAENSRPEVAHPPVAHPVPQERPAPAAHPVPQEHPAPAAHPEAAHPEAASHPEAAHPPAHPGAPPKKEEDKEKKKE